MIYDYVRGIRHARDATRGMVRTCPCYDDDRAIELHSRQSKTCPSSALFRLLLSWLQRCGLVNYSIIQLHHLMMHDTNARALRNIQDPCPRLQPKYHLEISPPVLHVGMPSPSLVILMLQLESNVFVAGDVVSAGRGCGQLVDGDDICSVIVPVPPCMLRKQGAVRAHDVLLYTPDTECEQLWIQKTTYFYIRVACIHPGTAHYAAFTRHMLRVCINHMNP